MKALCVPVISKRFIESLGKTAIEFNLNGTLATVFAKGDQSQSEALLANIIVNEVGDSFVATSDSKKEEGGKPLFLKGQTVVRQKQSLDFKSFAGEGSESKFAQAANAFGLQLNVIMKG